MKRYRPQFEEALRILGRASEAMKRRGLPAPVLVGGAAVEIYSNSAINTGDFDVVTAWQQQEFEEELRRLGFVPARFEYVSNARFEIECIDGAEWVVARAARNWLIAPPSMRLTAIEQLLFQIQGVERVLGPGIMR